MNKTSADCPEDPKIANNFNRMLDEHERVCIEQRKGFNNLKNESGEYKTRRPENTGFKSARLHGCRAETINEIAEIVFENMTLSNFS